MPKAQLIVYPTKDLEKAKKLFTALLGTEPYADAPATSDIGRKAANSVSIPTARATDQSPFGKLRTSWQRLRS